MDDKYAALQRQSYAGQETSFTFPEQEGITHTLLGFQPLGHAQLLHRLVSHHGRGQPLHIGGGLGLRRL